MPVMLRGRRVFRGRHVTVYFDLDRSGIARCAVGPELRNAVNDNTEQMRRHARALAERFTDTGRYRDSFQVVPGFETLPVEWPMRRVAADLVNTAPYSRTVEVGRGNRPARRVFGDTLEHFDALAKIEAAALRVKLPRKPSNRY